VNVEEHSAPLKKVQIYGERLRRHDPFLYDYYRDMEKERRGDWLLEQMAAQGRAEKRRQLRAAGLPIPARMLIDEESLAEWEAEEQVPDERADD